MLTPTQKHPETRNMVDMPHDELEQSRQESPRHSFHHWFIWHQPEIHESEPLSKIWNRKV